MTTSSPPTRNRQGLSIIGGTSSTAAEMDEVKAAGGGCLLIRHVRLLFQRFQAICCALCAAFLQPDAHRRLHHVPRTPDFEPSFTVAPGLEGQIKSSCSDMRSETTDVSVAPELEVNCSLSSLLPNPDLGPCSTEAPGLEHCPARCSETKSAEVVPKSSKVVPDPDVNRSLVHRLPKPVRATACNLSIPPGFEKIWVKKRETTDSDIVARPAVSLSTISQPPKPVPESGSRRGPRLEEQVFSSCSETTDSGTEGALDLQQTEISCSFSDTKDSDGLSEGLYKPSFHFGKRATHYAWENISLGLSDTVNSGVLSDQLSAQQRFYGEATVTANSSIGVLVVEEPKLTEKVAKGLTGVAFGKLDPNAKEFVPAGLKFGDGLVRAKEDWDLQQRLKPNAKQSTLGWFKGKSCRPFPDFPNHPAVDLGTAPKQNYETMSKAKYWTRGPGQSSDAEVVWGFGGLKKTSTGIPGRAQDLNLPSGHTFATPPRRREGRRERHRSRTFYTPWSPKSTVPKASHAIT